MPELRWALIGLGALFVAILALWEWRRARRRHAQAAAGMTPLVAPGAPAGEDWRRIEPRIDDLPPPRAAAQASGWETQAPEWDEAEAPLEEVPVIHPAEPVSVAVSAESAVDVPAAARPAPRSNPPTIRWPPERADRVLSLRVANAHGALLPGRQVRLALEQSGMVHGPQCIYHRIDEHGAVLASAANLLRPGDLDPQQMDELQLRGLSLFSVLPGPLPPVRMLEELVSLARAVAWRLGAAVQDDHGEELDGERLVKLRQSLPELPDHEAT